jgi:hypothetical protein
MNIKIYIDLFSHDIYQVFGSQENTQKIQGVLKNKTHARTNIPFFKTPHK